MPLLSFSRSIYRRPTDLGERAAIALVQVAQVSDDVRRVLEQRAEHASSVRRLGAVLARDDRVVAEIALLLRLTLLERYARRELRLELARRTLVCAASVRYPAGGFGRTVRRVKVVTLYVNDCAALV